jgi:hypothetical protein
MGFKRAAAVRYFHLNPNRRNIQMADANAQAKEQLAKSNEAKAKSVEEAYAHGGTPTPTQEESDLAALGVHTDEHADDGSGPSPEFRLVNVARTKQSEASKPSGGGYQTRAATPRAAPTTQS